MLHGPRVWGNTSNRLTPVVVCVAVEPAVVVRLELNLSLRSEVGREAERLSHIRMRLMYIVCGACSSLGSTSCD